MEIILKLIIQIYLPTSAAQQKMLQFLTFFNCIAEVANYICIMICRIEYNTTLHVMKKLQSTKYHKERNALDLNALIKQLHALITK